MRTFKPSKPNKTTVRKWTWTKGHGLKAHFKDGLVMTSAWTLTELLKADHTKGDGLPCIEEKGTTTK